MGRSTAVLLLTLVLGAFAAAHAGVYYDDWSKEPNENKCSLKQPSLRYTTYGCPTCDTKPECIKTECSKDDGKADVKFNLKCMFGGNVKFAAVSYKDVCYNNVNVNKWGTSYGEELVLPKISCKELPKMMELRFIVQDKWWYNPLGKALEKGDCCYDKCIHGKPCHTCEFIKKINIPACDHYNCKKPMCDTDKPYCPEKEKMDKCFDYDRSDEKYVKVTFKKDCHKMMKHFACSYHDYDNDHEKSVEHKWSDNTVFSFKAKCESSFKWFFEDDNYVNQFAPNYPSPGDKCWDYFNGGKICNRCGCDKPVYVGKCKEKGRGKGGEN
jgi:hypothetical protein